MAVCAWEADLWVDFKNDTEFFDDHEPVFHRLRVLMDKADDGYTMCKFTEAQARAYQLLHILLHELGHHHDRMTTKSQVRASRGEPYAEQYALTYEARIWEHYQETFGGF